MKRTIVHILFMLVCTHLWAQVDTVSTHFIDEVEVKGTEAQEFKGSGRQEYRIDAGDFARLNITDLNSALQRLPSITLKDYGGAGGMKTVSIRGLGSQHTGVCLDGVMLSEVQGGQIDLSQYSIDNMESISLTFNNDGNIFVPARQLTAAGVLEVQTVKGSKVVSGGSRWFQGSSLTAQLKGGSFGYVSPSLRYWQDLGRKMVLGATADFTHADNDYSFLLENGAATKWEKRSNSRMNSGHGDVQLLWQPDAESEYRVKVYYYDNKRQLPGIVRYYTNLSEESVHDRNCFAQLTLRYGGIEWLKIRGALKWNWQMTDYRNPLYVGNIMDSKYWQREYYATTALCFSPLRNVAFNYSVDFTHNNLNSTRDTDTRPWRSNLLQSLAGRYENRWLTATATVLRTDCYNGEGVKRTEGVNNYHRFSPLASLGSRFVVGNHGQTLLSTFCFELYFKEIYRLPTFNELYYYHLGTQNLLPEKARMLGFSADYSLRSKCGFLLSATASVYKNSIRDKISSVPYNMFVWKCVNIGRAEGWGVDMRISGSWDLGNREHVLGVMGSYSLQHMVDRTTEGSRTYGNQLAYIPRNSYSIVGSWENPWVNVSVSNVLSGENWANNEHYADSWIKGYVLWGLSLWREFGKSGVPRFRVQLDVQNAFNYQYSIVKGYPMPGRRILLTLKMIIDNR